MKRDGRSVSRAALEAQMRAVAYERMKEGESPAAVSASFGRHRVWAYKLRSKFKGRGKGKRAVQSTRASGRPPELDATQQRQVFCWINGKNQMQHGFAFVLWARQIARDLIGREFAVKLSLASVGTLLAKLRLTVQKQLQRTYQRDPEAVGKGQKTTYPQIERKARKEGAEIYFWDESGFRAYAVPGMTWSAKSQAPVVTVPGQRKASVQHQR
jgi:transposase